MSRLINTIIKLALLKKKKKIFINYKNDIQIQL